MANSFTAAPGEMPYDDDASCERPTNCVCPDCGARFWKGRDDSGGDLCDACADAVWMAEQDRRRRRQVWEPTGEWADLLDEVEDYLDDHMDVLDGDDGQPRPNRAMSLHTRLTALRGGTGPVAAGVRGEARGLRGQ